MAPLSPIEARILELYRQGKSYKEICQVVPIGSINTLKTHCRRIILKCLAHNLRHAAWILETSPNSGKQLRRKNPPM